MTIKMPKILVLHGPNLNMLGRREPEIYGSQTLQDIENLCRDHADKINIKTEFFQSNHEGEIIDILQKIIDTHDGLIINAGAYTHTSVAIHDALKLLHLPIIEIHISDPQTREEFRHHSYISPLAAEIIKGQGVDGYAQAIDKIGKLIQN